MFCPRYAWEDDPALCLYALALVRVRTDQPSYLILSGVVCRSCFIMPMQLRLKAIYSEFQARETTDYTLMVVSRGKTDLPSEEQKKNGKLALFPSVCCREVSNDKIPIL